MLPKIKRQRQTNHSQSRDLQFPPMGTPNKNRFGEYAGKKTDERANPFIEENRLMTARTQAPSEKEHFH